MSHSMSRVIASESCWIVKMKMRMELMSRVGRVWAPVWGSRSVANFVAPTVLWLVAEEAPGLFNGK